MADIASTQKCIQNSNIVYIFSSKVSRARLKIWSLSNVVMISMHENQIRPLQAPELLQTN